MNRLASRLVLLGRSSLSSSQVWRQNNSNIMPITSATNQSLRSIITATPDDSDIVINQSKEGLLTLRLNRPKKLNSITKDMYQKMTSTLKEAAKDDSVKMALLTGSGPYYSAGNDLSAFGASSEDPMKAAEEGKKIMIDFLESFIDFPKPFVGGVNGPCIGIMMTSLSLVDVVWSSDSATFSAPFSATAQSPEGASSLTFPLIFGPSLANEILLFNRKISAEEALRSGFVSRIFGAKDFLTTIESELKVILEEASSESMIRSKRLARNDEAVKRLKAVVAEEADALVQSWLSPDFPLFIFKFMTKNKKK